ncbi:MAG: rod shape-determining protein MreD [Bacteroidota bacterium]|nr:rod shape-determining protein MreD [Bacteroidota bacterium]
MTELVFKNIGRFLFLVFLQILILNNIQLGGYINPYLYIYFILLLPWETPRWLLLLSSFLIGITIDMFTNTPGLNAASSVMMASFRPLIIRSLSTGTEFLIGENPSLKNQGMKWFFNYSLLLVLIHHTVLFFLETFRISEFLMTSLRMILSVVFTMILIFGAEYLFYSKK